ncbi:hypothetical protein U0070_001112 [Myodes glareolus]|uniref:Large ribosomal subunit protein uL10 n=1 Tax=Myodes glareolus TaxID=447135 RepID=A0AAW0IXV7_MYOGA
MEENSTQCTYQDAHEFLSQCLDQLKEDMEKLNKTWKTEPILGEENPPDASATKVFTCPVIANLEFEVQHSIICKACGEIIPKREQFNDLSIDLPRRKKPLPPRSIQDSLDLFFRAEELEYSCEKCGGKCALVRHKFNRLPRAILLFSRVLILHLKRYSFNVALSLNNKIGQQVIIPRYLTLSSHCTENTKPPFTLGWSAHMAISRPLKASQMVNSCITSPSTPSKKFTFKSRSSFTSCLDSDSEDELKRSVALSQRLCDMSGNEQQQEDVEKDSKLENSGFDRMSEEEVLAAVLEISRREALPVLCREDDDKPTSSPDTGFAEDDVQEMPENPDAMEAEKPKTIAEPDPASFSEITKDCDENKENKTPEGSQGEVDWLQQYDMEREREEQELQQALAQSLQEQEAWEQKEDDDLKRATELSLQDSVGSKQMRQIRMSMRGKAVVLMGKNTMMRKAIWGHPENNPALEKLLPHIRGNVGFVFTKENLTEIRDMLLANKALGITTKISRGTLEILSDVQLIKTGDKVGASEATLLNMNISPFSFGLIIQQVFDNGSFYNPEVLDITEQALLSRFLEDVRNVASVCLKIGYPTVAPMPHSIINGSKRVLALSVETEYTFPLAEKVKAFLADPSAFVATATAAAAAAAATAAPCPQTSYLRTSISGVSIAELNNPFLDSLGSDEDSGNEDIFDMEYTEAEAEELKRNAETGNLPHSYRLISVVSHIGSTSSSGHYISDVYDIKKQAWFTYNDLEVSKIQESSVQSDRDRSGYIFFYMHKEIFDELLETEKTSQALSMEVGKTTLQTS